MPAPAPISARKRSTGLGGGWSWRHLRRSGVATTLQRAAAALQGHCRAPDEGRAPATPPVRPRQEALHDRHPHSPGRPAVDPDRLQALVEQAVGDFGAVLNAALVVVGDRLGLYRALAERGSSTPAELAAATGTVERNVREWLSAQAAAGYVTYDGRPTAPTASRSRPSRPRRSPTRTARPSSSAASRSSPRRPRPTRRSPRRSAAAAGVGWHEHHHDLFEGTERFFRPGYAANLVDAWLPALDGVVDRLADRRTGRRRRLRPRRLDDPDGPGVPAGSTFVGSDYHASSIGEARAAAELAGVGQRRVRGRPAPTTSRARRTTWSATSTACTTWATRSGALRHARTRSPRTAS